MEKSSQTLTVKLHGGKKLLVSQLATISKGVALLVLSCFPLAALHSAPVLAEGCNPTTLFPPRTYRLKCPLTKVFFFCAFLKRFITNSSGEKLALNSRGRSGICVKRWSLIWTCQSPDYSKWNLLTCSQFGFLALVSGFQALGRVSASTLGLIVFYSCIYPTI